MALSEIPSGFECFGFLAVMKQILMHLIMHLAREISVNRILIRLSRDLHSITVKMEVIIN